MSTTKPHQLGSLATADDCARLWMTLTTDFIPALRIEVTPHHAPEGPTYFELEVCDYSGILNLPGGCRSVWARKRFASPIYLISHVQLFDLLISAFRVMERYFATGEDNRPSPLKD